MAKSLAGRSVLITGASSGIGRATALACAHEGMRVALMARRRERLEEIASGIRARGGAALVVTGDVSIEEDCRRAVRETEGTFGHLDVLINNAGYGVLSWFEETSAPEARRILEVNLLGSFHPTAAALPGMKARRKGHILFVSSGVGKKGVAGYSLYSASKFGQVGLADSLRAEVLASGVAVSVVYPISTATDFRAATVRPGVHPVPRPTGGPTQTAEHVAHCIVRCLRKPRAEVYPYRPLRLLSVLNQLFPGLATRLIALRQGVPRAPG